MIREAGRLFASRGIENVTLQDIIDASGQGNKSAVHYHFGSRDGLIRAILDLHQAEVNEDRLQLLSVLDSQHRVTLRDVVDCLTLPPVRKLETESGRDYLQLIAQLVNRLGSSNVLTVRGPHIDSLRQTMRLLSDALSGIPLPIRQSRISQVVQFVAVAVADRAAAAQRTSDLALSAAVFQSDMSDVIVAALRAPVSRRTADHLAGDQNPAPEA